MGTLARITLFTFLIVSFVVSCKNKSVQVSRAYYFWRTNTNPTKEEINFLKQHRVNKLYCKLMDVDWSEVYGAFPVAETNVDDINFDINERDSVQANVVPVLFLTNKVFQHINSSGISLLAKRVVRKCLFAYDSADFENERRTNNFHRFFTYYRPLQPVEIQFDCDWTVSTAKKYFTFLQTVRDLLPDSVMISATIRLHQFKYSGKTGVPPVDRGMLMMYNTSDLTKYSTTNSIFDSDKAKAYFSKKIKYPLPLDIALAAYSWCIIFRDKKFYQLENQLSEAELRQCSFLKPMMHHFYRVERDTVYNDLLLRRGDEIKVENISSQSLQEAAKIAVNAVNSELVTIALFELSENEIINYNYETIEAVYASYY